MKLLNASQIRKLDELTIALEPISSIELMERAAEQCTDWIIQNQPVTDYAVFCGLGNNGGDGLAIARQLDALDKKVNVYQIGDPNQGSTDLKTNFERLKLHPNISIFLMDESSPFPEIPVHTVVIDAIFGTGLTRSVDGWRKQIINCINDLPNITISIDTPSGLFADPTSGDLTAAVSADYTLTFQIPKSSFLFRESQQFTGEVVILDIGLHKETHEAFNSNWLLTNQSDAHKIIKKRLQFDHKGDFKHVLVVAGSKGRMGAAVLCTQATLRSGAGLVTAHIPECGYTILQTAVPEAMCITSSGQDAIAPSEISPRGFTLCAGPGLGINEKTAKALELLIEKANSPLVLDADALNYISTLDQFPNLPPKSILTPHPKEFDRLFGDHSNAYQRLQTLIKKSAAHNIVIVLKGAFTRIGLPDGRVFFNNSGNPGMATAGSGDVLTGIIAGFVAQHYSPEEAAILGVYLHGLSGDISAAKKGVHSLIASDIIDNLGKAFIATSTL